MSELILLDVGGQLFKSTKLSLTSIPNYFTHLLDENNWKDHHDKNVPIFIDRDPETFSSILSYLRSNKIIFGEDQSDTYLQKLCIEADFFQLHDLVDLISQELKKRKTQINELRSNKKIFKIIKLTDANHFFSQGWSYVDKFNGHETLACMASGVKEETLWINNRCTYCNEIMTYDKFSKHSSIFQPLQIVISKEITLSDIQHHDVDSINYDYDDNNN